MTTSERPYTVRVMKNRSYSITPPVPGALIESLRAFGYTPQAACADLIDNSVSAGADTIRLDALWDGETSWIRISDNGSGMNESELQEAMRLGGNGPLAERSEHDLGRFGLGLKTASFSQCRNLSVASSCSDGQTSIRCWDLDYVGKSDQWRLLTSVDPATEALLGNPIRKTGSGTVVLWKNMDRIVKDANVNDASAQRLFHEVLRDIEEHLAMVFHRFMAGRNRIRISIGDMQLKPWDPFMLGKPGLQELPEDHLWIGNQEMTVQPYVLPHQSRLTKREHKLAAGPNGWNGQQGFYVYRNRRLLVAGDWLGLGFKKEEHYKLARIQIDIPNTLDSEWDIDVRKSRARPPWIIRGDLRRIAETTRERAVTVYRHRGKLLKTRQQAEQIDVWSRMIKDGKIHYRLNRKHPALEQLLTKNTDSAPLIESVFRMVEETVPIAAISIDHSERSDQQRQPFEDVSPSAIREAASSIMNTMVQQGETARFAGARLMLVEPFQLYPEIVATLVQEHEGAVDGN